MTEPEVFEVLRKIRYDLTAAQAKLTEALNMLASMDLPSRFPGEHECPHCHFDFGSERTLALHIQNVHDGPEVPWTELEIAG